MAGRPPEGQRFLWDYAGTPQDTRYYRQKADSLLESDLGVPEHADGKGHIGRFGNVQYKDNQLDRVQNLHPHPGQAGRDRVFDVSYPVENLETPQEKDKAGKFVRATTQSGPAPNMQIGSLPGTFRRPDNTQIDPQNVQQTHYEQGFRKEGDRRPEQFGDVNNVGDASNVLGPTFYEGNTEHFRGNNPYRVTTKAVDDFVSDTAQKLVGNREPNVVRDENGDIIGGVPRSNEKRLRTQHNLANLSRTLLDSYDDLNLNIRDFRNVSQQDGRTGEDIHQDDVDNYNRAAQNYDIIAEGLDYLNTDEYKWSGTLRHNAQGGLSIKHGSAGDAQLFSEDSDMTGVADDIGEQIMRGQDSGDRFYFQPELSNYNIKVADKKSAIALGITLRQFFDLQVLYYKKHVEILQVFQLLVVFFEKYNYSINSLMYILEHLVKDKVQPKEGEAIEVPIPIDFTKSVIGMLADQKNMMNVISTFKSHLGMEQGEIHRVGGRIFQPDDTIFLDDTHVGVFANAVPYYENGAYGAETYTGPNAQWYPGYHEGDEPVGLATYFVGDANGVFFPPPAERDNRPPGNPHPGAQRPPRGPGGRGGRGVPAYGGQPGDPAPDRPAPPFAPYDGDRDGVPGEMPANGGRGVPADAERIPTPPTHDPRGNRVADPQPAPVPVPVAVATPVGGIATGGQGDNNEPLPSFSPPTEDDNNGLLPPTPTSPPPESPTDRNDPLPPLENNNARQFKHAVTPAATFGRRLEQRGPGKHDFASVVDAATELQRKEAEKAQAKKKSVPVDSYDADVSASNSGGEHDYFSPELTDELGYKSSSGVSESSEDKWDRVDENHQRYRSPINAASGTSGSRRSGIIHNKNKMSESQRKAVERVRHARGLPSLSPEGLAEEKDRFNEDIRKKLKLSDEYINNLYEVVDDTGKTIFETIDNYTYDEAKTVQTGSKQSTSRDTDVANSFYTVGNRLLKTGKYPLVSKNLKR